jgi:general L-amino acid transport system permease protein
MTALLQRLRRDCFANRLDAAISVVLVLLLGTALVALARWALFQAQWAVIQVNATLFALGRYPLEQQWRLWLITALLAAASGCSWGLLRALPRRDRRLEAEIWPANDRIAVVSFAGLAVVVPALLGLTPALQLRWWLISAVLLLCRWACGRLGRGRRCRQALRLLPLAWPSLYLFALGMIGGGLGLISVPPGEWGGLLLTLVQASLAILLCFPLGVLLALGRRSKLPLLRWSSVLYIEFIRGAPLITLLFLGQNILGFLLPGGVAPERVWRAALVLTLFAAAYLAEAVRAGLAAVPRGQLEAARSLGLSTAQAMARVVLPQAIRTAVPAMVGQFISLLQDTTLLSLIGLLELLGTARTVMANPAFLGRNAEVYLTLAILFWCCCAALGLGSRALERRLNPNTTA